MRGSGEGSACQVYECMCVCMNECMLSMVAVRFDCSRRCLCLSIT
jgi:hypothetical protein